MALSNIEIAFKRINTESLKTNNVGHTNQNTFKGEGRKISVGSKNLTFTELSFQMNYHTVSNHGTDKYLAIRS